MTPKRLRRKHQVAMAFWVYNYAAQVMDRYDVPEKHQVAILDVLWGLAADRRVKVKYPADAFHRIGKRYDEPDDDGTVYLGCGCISGKREPTIEAMREAHPDTLFLPSGDGLEPHWTFHGPIVQPPITGSGSTESSGA